ncbi:TPA: bacteriocin, partial [Enterococcus faecium]|nr:bacteriocin [Enterococcus faecium]
LLVALAGGGAALYYFKFKKPKAETTGSDDLGEYDFGEDEDLEDEEPETEFDPEADFVSEQEDEE